jgi:hypothetical protein
MPTRAAIVNRHRETFFSTAGAHRPGQNPIYERGLDLLTIPSTRTPAPRFIFLPQERSPQLWAL